MQAVEVRTKVSDIRVLTIRPPAGARLAGAAALLATAAGGALIVTTAAIHLHLWLAGYRHVHRLGPLFMAQAVTGFILGPILVAFRHWLLVLVGAGFMAASVVGLVLSATVGFVGIHDGLGVPWASTSLAVELAGFVLLGSVLVYLVRPLLPR